ncbi:MAG: hypothetical protein Q4G05_00500 [Clostridia bacterium]|nr:hypothetical protein [Clostridia bacterium]
MENNRGYTGIDISIAIMIIIMAIAILSTLLAKTLNNIREVEYNSNASIYMVQMLEGIDKCAYESVDNTNGNLVNTFRANYHIPTSFDITMQIEELHLGYVKRVTLRIEYLLDGSTESFEVKKLKVKEI